MAPRKAASSVYDDELSAEEAAAVAEFEQSNDLPPAEDDDEDPGNAPPSDAPPAEEKPKPAEQPKPADQQEPPADQQPPADPPSDQQPPAGQSEEERFKAWLEKHKDKSPEELQRLAFQQSQRANKGEATARVAGQNLEALASRVTAAMERRNALSGKAGEAKQSFREKLAQDPDAATAEVHDRLVDADIAAADAELDDARIAAAVGFARAHVPDFDQRWEGMKGLAGELGYTPEEIAGIRDGRDIVTFSLAQLSANLIKAGVIDIRGNLTVNPQPSTEEVTDPRLKTPEAIKTLGSGGSRSSDGAKTPEQAVQDLLALSDEEFDKLPQSEIDKILRAAG